MTTPRTLAEVTIGQTATVLTLGCVRSTSRRLMEMGLLPNTPVRVSRVAPMGCPIELSVRGAQLSIRKADAALISVTSGHAADVAAGASR